MPSSFLSVPRFRMLYVMSLYLCLWCHMQYRFHNSSHTLMGNAHGMGLGRQVVYSIPSSSRPYPFLISSIPRERRRDPVTHSPVPPSPSPFCLRNPIPIPLSRCSALIQDDDREREREGWGNSERSKPKAKSTATHLFVLAL